MVFSLHKLHYFILKPLNSGDFKMLFGDINQMDGQQHDWKIESGKNDILLESFQCLKHLTQSS